MNIFIFHSQICKSSNLIPESVMYNTMAETLDKIGKEDTLKAIEAHRDNCTNDCELWLKMFMQDAYWILYNN